MRPISLVIFFHFFGGYELCAQSSDTVYYLKFISNETQKEIPFVRLFFSDQGYERGYCAADEQGILRLTHYQKLAQPYIEYNSYQKIRSIYSETKFTAKCNGYFNQVFDAAALQVNDTVEIRMSSGYSFMEMLEIVSYRVPLINPVYVSDPAQREYLESVEKSKRDTYSTDDLATYDSIVTGAWFENRTPDIILNNEGDFYTHLAKNIYYPEHARDSDIQETIYFLLTFDSDGMLTEIKFGKGNSPDLVIEVARVLKKIARVKYVRIADGMDAQTLILPIQFNLK